MTDTETLRKKIEALADKLWRVHPKQLDAAGYVHTSYGGKYDNPRAAWYADQIEELIAALTPSPEAQAEPVGCPECGDTGMRDTGGVYPWGEGIHVACDCPAGSPPAPQPEALAAQEQLKVMLEALQKVYSAIRFDGEHSVFKSGVRIGDLKRTIEAALYAAGRKEGCDG